MRTSTVLVILGALCAWRTAGGQGDALRVPETRPIIGINTPALSPDGSRICFSYLGDLWIVPSGGGEAKRLTVHEAHDAYPRWSPDGRWIAFASDRYPTSTVNYDVYVMPSEGGEARRLTYHTNNDYPFDWSPDGSKLLLQAIRGTPSWQAVELDVKSGATRVLTRERNPVRYPSYSPDGRHIIFNLSGMIGAWWRPKYHGSANMDVVVRDLSTGRTTSVTDYDGADLWPSYGADGSTIFYVSDILTPGVPNVVRVALKGGRPQLVTKHSTGAVTWPHLARGRMMVYVHAGELYMCDTANPAPQKVRVLAPSDDKRNTTQRATLTSGATELEVSPDGKTLGLALRGDIWTIPAGQGGEARRLTDDPAADLDFVWSPDGSKMAVVSDRRGTFGVYVLDVKSGEMRLVSNSTGDAESPQWSPDGKLLAYLAGGTASGLYVRQADASAPARRIAESEGNNKFGIGITSYAWSPDGKWIAFSRRDPTNATDIWLSPVDKPAPVNITQYPGSNVDPRWTSDGRYLLFLSSRDREQGQDLYAVPLRKAAPDDGAKQDEAATAGKVAEVKIDLELIEDRAKRLTTSGVGAYDLAPNGRLAFGITSFGQGGDYFSVPVAGGTVQRISTTGDAFGAPRFGPVSDRFYGLAAGGTVRSYAASGPGWSTTPVGFEARLTIDMRAARRQAFNEFWRAINSGFYDPGMHGVDWHDVRRRYEPLLDGIATPEELAFFVLAPMVGELNASHVEVSPAVAGPEPDVADPGLLFDETYPGPGLRVKDYLRDGPSDEHGPLVRPGEYVLSVDGRDVQWTEMMWSAWSGRAGKATELLVNNEPVKEGARTVKLTPVAATRVRDIEYENSVRTARQETEKQSGGRIGYVRIRGMDAPSMRRFERELWGYARSKEALVVDIRDNGGGSTHDAILAQLARTPYALTQPRDGTPSTQPFRQWGKPTVLLINENSVSDAEVLPMGFRALGLGKIVGTPTPGYVIGTYSGRLQDGTTFRVPMWSWLGLDGKNLENVGVKPDIVVPRSSEDFEAGRDPQLAAAVAGLLKELPRQ